MLLMNGCLSLQRVSDAVRLKRKQNNFKIAQGAADIRNKSYKRPKVSRIQNRTGERRK